MPGPRKLVIFGNSGFAQIAHQYFSFDSAYQVVAFTVERTFLKQPTFEGLPLVPYEELEDHFPAANHSIFIACTYTQLNRLRTRIAHNARARGYALASYISSAAFVWRNVTLGEHCFIFENNVVQPYCELGDNIILWSGNHIGHHSRIASHCFFASHVVVSGHVDVGESCFFGVNVTVSNNLRIGHDCWFSPTSLVKRDVAAGSMFRSGHSSPAEKTTHEFFAIAEDEVA